MTQWATGRWVAHFTGTVAHIAGMVAQGPESAQSNAMTETK